MQEETVIQTQEEPEILDNQGLDTEVEAPLEENDNIDLAATFADLQAENERLTAELLDAKEQNLRFQADFTNFRRRKDKETAETISFANEGLIKQILPILDDFERTLSAIEKTDNLTAIKDGIGMVAKNMSHILGKIGVSVIEAKGQTFDSQLHEAITSIPVEDEAQKGLVFDEMEKGYKLKEKVIRFSKVVVTE